MPEPWSYERARSFFDYEAQPKERALRCDLCGVSTFGNPGDGKGGAYFVDWTDRYRFPVYTLRCHQCGLLFQMEPMTPAGLRALYSGPYRALVSAWHGREINAQTLEPEQIGYGIRVAENCLGPVPNGARILDLGGSTGAVAQSVASVLDSKGATVVEPSMAEAAAAVGRYRVGRVVVQSAEDFEPGDERYDLILLCQTVDHLRSISTVLRKVRTWLAPGGRFFVDAVDVERIPEPVRYKVDHIYSLTRATMRAYLERAGFVAREVPAPSENHVAFLCEVAA